MITHQDINYFHPLVTSGTKLYVWSTNRLCYNTMRGRTTSTLKVVQSGKLIWSLHNELYAENLASESIECQTLNEGAILIWSFRRLMMDCWIETLTNDRVIIFTLHFIIVNKASRISFLAMNQYSKYTLCSWIMWIQLLKSNIEPLRNYHSIDASENYFKKCYICIKWKPRLLTNDYLPRQKQVP